ncbi:hypothetical protein GCM10009122_58970 [Fulvivirga kasyanovii]|uniref:Uncharacterized protein n=1 Tax=Fulvivirga kasyanovii TaxID=396812 RepID=A0ABW9RY89_9BACT|nr:hypothetical protein [Fulvivirga kasyanovii]MTI27990.1 hypothetical protein [Fulvivirga kasyanovii]
MKNLNNVIFLLLLVAAIAVSCKDDDVDCCTIVDTTIIMKFVDENGVNLLNDIAEHGIEPAGIVLYYKVNGQWEEYFEANLDAPKGYLTTEESGDAFFILYTDPSYSENNITEIKIQFTEDLSGILKAEFTQNGSNVTCTKVWYDDELKWDQTSQSERSFTVEL